MKRGTWILILVLCVLAVTTYFVLQRPGEISTSGASGAMLVDYDSAAVDKIDIRSAGGSVIVEKQGGIWMLTSPMRYKADDDAVTSALGHGRNIALTSLVSTNPEKQHLFDLDSNGTLVRIFDRGVEKAAFHIGKPGPRYTETYVRRDGSNNVHLASGYFTSSFPRNANGWRDKSIFKADQSAIAAVTFHYGDTLFVLTRPDTLWRVDREPANQDVVRGVLGALATIVADGFIDSSVHIMPPLTAQIDMPGAQIRFYRVGGGGGADRYYVQSSATPQLFEVNGWRVSQSLKRKKDFLAAGS